MGARYADVKDIIAVGKTLTPAQSEAAEVLLDMASARLRVAARSHGRDLDSMIADPVQGEDIAVTVRSVIVQAVLRAIDSVDNSAVVSQGTQSALGYSATVSYINAGQSLYFLRNELKDLGLLRQTYGGLEVYEGSDKRD